MCVCNCNIWEEASFFYRFYRWGSTALARRRGWRTLGRRSRTPRSAPRYLVRSGTTRKATAVGRRKGKGHRNVKRGLVILFSRGHKYDRFACNRLKLEKNTHSRCFTFLTFPQKSCSCFQESKAEPSTSPSNWLHFTLKPLNTFPNMPTNASHVSKHQPPTS